MKKLLLSLIMLCSFMLISAKRLSFEYISPNGTYVNTTIGGLSFDVLERHENGVSLWYKDDQCMTSDIARFKDFFAERLYEQWFKINVNTILINHKHVHEID